MIPSAPSRLAVWCLRIVTSEHQAEGILGDLTEELAHVSAERPVRWPRVWLEWRVWRYALTAAVHRRPLAAATADLKYASNAIR